MHDIGQESTPQKNNVQAIHLDTIEISPSMIISKEELFLQWPILQPREKRQSL